MERTKEELQQIYDDLLVLKKKVNWLSSFGQLLPTPLNGKTWEEEKDEFYNVSVMAHQNLLSSGKIKSCEVRTLCENTLSGIKDKKVEQGFWKHFGAYYLDSSEYEVSAEGTSLDSLIELLTELFEYEGLHRTQKRVNHILDSIGTSACTPRANLDIEPTESINVTPNAQSYSSKLLRG